MRTGGKLKGRRGKREEMNEKIIEEEEEEKSHAPSDLENHRGVSEVEACHCPLVLSLLTASSSTYAP